MEAERKVLEINKQLLGDSAQETIDSYKRTGDIEYILSDEEAAYHLTKYANTMEDGLIKDSLLEKA